MKQICFHNKKPLRFISKHRGFQSDQRPLLFKTILFSAVALSVTAHFGFTTFDLARLLIVTAVTQLLEGAFFVELLFQAAQSAVDNFAFLDADFSCHNKFTPSLYLENSF